MLTPLLVLLAAAALMAALLAHWRLPTALGYLALGVLLGPHSLGLLPDNETTRVLAELGVIFLMFIIGLEFSLPTLVAAWRMVLGLGAAEILVVGALATIGAVWAGVAIGPALLFGIALAMSSTAIVLKQLRDRGEIGAPHGRISVAILIFQDLVTLPLLAILPALHASDGYWAALRALATAAIAFVMLAWLGRKIVRPIFYWVAAQRSTELFTVVALLAVVASAAIANALGLSGPLGAFMAGLVLGETAYRHQIESDLHPFQAVLLGLFFATIGMLLNPGELAERWPWILVITAALIVGKGLVIALLLKFTGYEIGLAARTGTILGHGGEFGLLLISVALSEALLPVSVAQVVLASIILSMFAAPLMIQISAAVARRFAGLYGDRPGNASDQVSTLGRDAGEHVILCGFGRTGQNIVEMLGRQQCNYVALDLDPARVRTARAASIPVLFGDATRRAVLAAAGIDRARVLVITFDDARAAERTVSLAHTLNPGLTLLVRTRDDSHFDALKRAGASEVLPDALEASLMLGAHLLSLIGVAADDIDSTIDALRTEHYRSLRRFFHGADDPVDGHAYAEERRLLQPAGVVSTIAAWRRNYPGVDITGLIRGGVRTDNPPDDAAVRPGDILEICGESEALDTVERDQAGTRAESGDARAPGEL